MRAMLSRGEHATVEVAPRIVPRWLVVALGAVVLVQGATLVFGTRDVFAGHRSAPLHTVEDALRDAADDGALPANATREQRVTLLREQVRKLNKRARTFEQAIADIDRGRAQIADGSYPHEGGELLEQRRERLQQRLREYEEERDRAQALLTAQQLELAASRDSQ
jgi:hypothetical protein